MKKYIFICLAFIILVSFAFLSKVSSWKIDTENVVISFEDIDSGTVGSFTGLKGNIDFDPQNLMTAKIVTRLPLNTIDTGMEDQEKDILSDSYFDAEKYPMAYFIATKFEKQEEGFLVKGKFKLKDTAKLIKIFFTFKEEGNTAIFEGKTKINGKDYGIDTGEVEVKVKVPVFKK